MIELVCRGSEVTVPVTSRKAYMRLSANTMDPPGAIMAAPILETLSLNSVIDKSVRNPGIDSSLSMVPSVWPSPRPAIIGTLTPKDATSGARMILL